MERPDAPAVLEGLFRRGTPAGKLHALLGLWYVDRGKYHSSAAKLRSSLCAVAQRGGCPVFGRNAEQILQAIETGRYDSIMQREP